MKYVAMICSLWISAFCHAETVADSNLPEHYTSESFADGAIAHWNRLYRAGTNENLVRTGDGVADVYVRSAVETHCAVTVGLLHRRGANYTMIPLEYSATYPSFYRLSSKYDASNEEYLIYSPNLPFVPLKNSKTSSWESFDAWLFDIKSEKIEHIILPPGPWVADAQHDGIFLRAVKNFSCGTDCYRGYDLQLINGKIQVNISGKPSAISLDVTGSYKLAPDGKSWQKI